MKTRFQALLARVPWRIAQVELLPVRARQLIEPWSGGPPEAAVETGFNRAPTPSAGSPDAWLTWRVFAGILALLILARFPAVLLGSSSFVYRDFGLFGYPAAHYFRQSFWSGEVPLWNPLSNCGLPFLAQWNTIVCYPPSLIYLLLPLPWSLNLFSLLHLLLAGVTMFLLAHRWTDSRLAAAMAGFAFAASGTAVSTLIWPNYIATLAWTPAVILCTERAWQEGRRWLVMAGLVGTMHMLSGTPEVILFTWLVVLGLWAGAVCSARSSRARLIGRLLAVVALVTGLSAAQLLPFLDLLVHSQRNTQFSTGAYALPFSGLANYLVPLFRTTATSAGVRFQPEQFYLSSLYGGIGVLGLALCALVRVRERRVWLVAAMLLASLWVALGDNGLLYGWIRQAIPAANFMRYPVKCALAVSFLLPLLAAFGVKEWTANHSTDRDWERRCALVWAGLALGCGAILAGAFWFPLHESDWAVTWRSALSRLLFLGLTGWTLWGMARVRNAGVRIGLGAGLLALVWLDGISHAPSQNPLAPPSVYAAGLPVLDQMVPRPVVGQSRALLSLQALDDFHNKNVADQADGFLLRRVGLSENANLIDAVTKVDGFWALYLPQERDVHFRLYDADGAARTNLADFLGVSQVTSRDNILEWSARPNPMPLITAGQVPVFLDSDAALNYLMNERFDPRATVVLPPEARRSLTATNRSDCRIVSSQMTAHHVSVTVEAAQTALVVVSQVHYHPWQASVDGRAVPIWRGNHAFQTVEVPAGRHEVRLVYRDRAFQAGVILTALTLLVSAGLWRRGGSRSLVEIQH